LARRSAFDVVVVGASIAGCTAARLFALAGARVALVEQRPDPAAYKVVCTHNIQPSATATIERLGLAAPLDARGAVRSHPEAWTPYGGWVRFPTDGPHGYGVTRATLDPMLRELAAGTPGVDLLPGQAAVRLVHDDGRIGGVEVEGPDRKVSRLPARLLVGADGRHSTVARLARMRGRVRPNNRFFYFAYWRGVNPRPSRPRLWLLDPEAAAVFPNEDDLTVIVVCPHRARLDAVRADPESAYREMVDRLPGGPDLSTAERASKLIGALERPNVIRPAAQPGVALVGDAALSADPLFGVGCGWAFQTSEWLVDHTAAAVAGGDDLDAALRRYRRAFRRRLFPHYVQVADFATGRRLRVNERLGMRAAAVDPAFARAVEEVSSRRRSPLRLLDPRLAPHAVRGLSRAAAARSGPGRGPAAPRG
jgi:2-polyprenyl-6-methoxyphenol hydroxylase-like FAD-dependent oxidoreductase